MSNIRIRREIGIPGNAKQFMISWAGFDERHFAEALSTVYRNKLAVLSQEMAGERMIATSSEPNTGILSKWIMEKRNARIY